MIYLFKSIDNRHDPSCLQQLNIKAPFLSATILLGERDSLKSCPGVNFVDILLFKKWFIETFRIDNNGLICQRCWSMEVAPEQQRLYKLKRQGQRATVPAVPLPWNTAHCLCIPVPLIWNQFKLGIKSCRYCSTCRRQTRKMKKGHGMSKQAPVSSRSLFSMPFGSHQVKREEKKRKPFASSGNGESETNCP